MLAMLACALTFQGLETKAFVHATVIDGTGAAPIKDATVLIEGRKIIYAGPSKGFSIPRNAKRIDATGKFIIPGLWDMHTHVDDPELLELNPKPEEKEQWLPLFVLNGVTAIREMAGDLDLLKSWRERVGKKQLFGPRMWFGGPLVDGPQPMWPASIAVDTPEKAREAVRDLKSKGADFVKVYSLLPKDCFFALMDEAKKQGIRASGHVPARVTNLEACEAGLNSIEHLLQLDRELADPAKVQEMRAKLPQGMERFAQFRAMREIYEKCYSPELTAKLAARYKELGTWIDPTLVVAYQNSTFNPKDPTMLARLPYIPAYVRDWWSPEKNVHLRTQGEDQKLGQQATFRIYKRIVADLRKAGIPMMTGSDMGGNPHCFAGWGVHDELKLLTECGLTPMEALVCATSNPARYTGVFDKLGSVHAGKLADMVVLNADPLKDISNTQKIEIVVADGRVMLRKELDQMLAQQKERVKKRL